MGKDQLAAGGADARFEQFVGETFAGMSAPATRWLYNHMGIDAVAGHALTEAPASWSAEEKTLFVLAQIHRVHAAPDTAPDSGKAGKTEKDRVPLRHALVVRLLRSSRDGLRPNAAQLAAIAAAFAQHPIPPGSELFSWPVEDLMNHAERLAKSGPLPQALLDALRTLDLSLADVHSVSTEQGRSADMLRGRLAALLVAAGNNAPGCSRILFTEGDAFAAGANVAIAAMPGEESDAWYRILGHAYTCSGGKPSGKFLKKGAALIAGLGAESFVRTMTDWIETLVGAPLSTEVRTSGWYYEEMGQPQNVPVLLLAVNSEIFKGLVWLCSRTATPALIQAIGELAARCFKKIPGHGPTALLVGNACIYTLARSGAREGVAALSRLKARVVHNSAQTLIGRYLTEVAEAVGMTVAEIEDLSVESHGLQGGTRTWEEGGYRAVLSIERGTRTALQWYAPDGSPDGKPQKSAPAALKSSPILKEIKAVTKAVEATLGAQRDRLDMLFRSDRRIAADAFAEHYLRHGLTGWLTARTVWNLHRADSSVAAALPVDGGWQDASGGAVDTADVTHFSLWHPALASAAEVEDWRSVIMARGIRQPVKQAFRKVYLLTDAERATRTYSNRMAAHILKQHQMAQLVKSRGWHHTLMGDFDSGGGTVSLELPEWGLRAEFRVEEVQNREEMTGAGIWKYVSTDQVRFARGLRGGEPLPLESVPPKVFSEVVRDVDLFVGVASVGADPAWTDGGERRAAQVAYWRDYSFGELAETGKTRRDVLSRLLPRLKIRGVARLEEKFLVVQGTLRIYKIHLGSGNILMEPNDQYLCIVPDHSGSKAGGDRDVFLPFEGDSTLSVILSKAFLLAEDHRITDPTITSQIRQR